MFELPAELKKRVEQLAAAVPDEIVTAWRVGDLRCYFASVPQSMLPDMYTAEEVIGRRASVFIRVSDVPHAAFSKPEDLLSGKPLEFTINFRNRHGEQILVRNRAAIVLDQGSDEGFFLARTVPAGRSLPERSEL